jgi:ABC-type dipeptide/oligopeptide/nickel transport system permease component
MTARGWIRWLLLEVLGRTFLLCLVLTLLVGAFLYTVPGKVDTTLPVRAVTGETTGATVARRGGYATFYASWVGRLARGDLGRTTNGFPVAEELPERLAVTAGLAFAAMALLMIAALLVAVAVVASRRRRDARLVLWAAYLANSLPTFVVSYVLIGLGSSRGTAGLLMPILVLLVGDGLILEVGRTLGETVLSELRRPYCELAAIKGLRTGAVWPLPGTVLGYAFRQAIILVLPRCALHLQVVVGLCLLVEKIFSLPGLSDMLLDGIGNRDVNRVLVVVLITALLVRVVSLVNDALIGLLNPRGGLAA